MSKVSYQNVNTEIHKIYFWTHEGPVDEGSRGVPGNQVKY